MTTKEKENGTTARRLTPRDLYLLRRAQLEAEARALEAQSAQRALREMLLELERRYGLLASAATVNVQTGEIQSP